MSASDRRVTAAVNRLREALADKCPRCRNPFVFDADGECFAVACACGCGFCAWCLADCGADAHRHVANCAANLQPGRAVFSSLALLQRCQRERHRAVATALLQEMDGAEAAEVVRLAGQTLRDHGLADVARLFAAAVPA